MTSHFISEEPWRALKPLEEQLQTQPTAVIAEVLFGSYALLCLIHAIAHGRRHVLLWVAALVSGTANDIFFMLLPFVDNFWHTSMCVMLTPRLPAYIPCVYVSFQYTGVAGSWALPQSHGTFGRAAAGALASAIFYAAYDLVGAKFLWWSWHDTDASISERWLGVPYGSTMWTVAHVFCFGLMFAATVPLGKSFGALRATYALICISILTTPLMMVFMGIFQFHQLRVDLESSKIDLFGVADLTVPLKIKQMPGKPDIVSLVKMCVALAAVVCLSSAARDGQKHITRRGYNGILVSGTFVYFATLLAVMWRGQPENVISTGLHQERGECHIVGHDLSGYARFEKLCEADFEEDFVLGEGCEDPFFPASKATKSWYTICGRPHEAFPLYLAAQAVICLFGFIAISEMFLSDDASIQRHTTKRDRGKDKDD